MREIYRTRYWAPLQLDSIAVLPGFADAANTIYDYSVNAGPGRAARWLQGCVGVAEDGRIGIGTLAAVRDYGGAYGPLGGDQLADCIVDRAAEHYVRISEARPSNESFAYGWIIRRVAHVPPGQQAPGLAAMQRCLNALNNQGRHYADVVVDGRWGRATRDAVGGLIARRGYDGLYVLTECAERLR